MLLTEVLLKYGKPLIATKDLGKAIIGNTVLYRYLDRPSYEVNGASLPLSHDLGLSGGTDAEEPREVGIKASSLSATLRECLCGRSIRQPWHVHRPAWQVRGRLLMVPAYLGQMLRRWNEVRENWSP